LEGNFSKGELRKKKRGFEELKKDKARIRERTRIATCVKNAKVLGGQREKHNGGKYEVFSTSERRAFMMTQWIVQERKHKEKREWRTILVKSCLKGD